MSRERELVYFTAAAGAPNLYDHARLILLTGMRPEEVLKIRKEYVDLDAGTVRILRGKTPAARAIVGRRLAKCRKWLFDSGVTGRNISRLNSAHDRLMIAYNNPRKGQRPRRDVRWRR